MNSIKLKPELEELDKVITFINNSMDTENLEIQLIAEEIFVNIVNYSQSTQLILNVDYDSNSHIIILEFIDDGIEFNMLEKDEHKIPDTIEEAKMGGLGIHLVKNLADNIEYEYDKENHLTITKKVKT